MEARLPTPQHGDGVGQDIGHGSQEPALPAEHARHQPRQAEGNGAGPRGSHGDVHAQPGGHPGGGPRLQPPLGGDHHHTQGGGDAAQGDQVPQDGELGQGDEDGASQDHQADDLPGGEAPLLPPARPGGEGHPVEVAGRPGEQQLGAEKDDLGGVPPAVRQIDEAGGAVEKGGHQGHEPHALVEPDIVEGEGHREDEDGRRHIAQARCEPQKGQVAKSRPHQGAEAVQPRAGTAHQSQTEGGPAAENLRTGQHGPQKEADGALRSPDQRRSPQHQPSRPGQVLTGPGRFHFQSSVCRHGLSPPMYLER